MTPRIRLATFLSLVVLVLGAGACGGSDEKSSSGGGSSSGSSGGTATATATATPTATTGGTADTAEGKKLFSGTCGGCHTLKDAGTNGAVGPNLDELKPDKQRVLNAIKAGPSVMPENLFEGKQANAVADYVSQNAGK